MRLLVLFAIMVSVLACKKSKDDDKLPKPLRDIIANTKDCTCLPFIDKYELTIDPQPQTQVIYLMSCEGPTCNCITLYYDENGDPTTLPPGHHLQLVKRVWSCGGR